ncbi:DUF5590 domain-containing protein [Peribacillus kribbensis]|uniref:cell wall elongation regulator TseB-like domain-containing protein n=1 Tax=Peribacillus kribbensis TaxID=356658 RepID=UPI00040977C7|nr:DUF5590 domain-containing protein [Peribacillus kribbensis]
MKKWIILVILFLVIAAAAGGAVYSKAVQPKKTAYHKAEVAAKDHGLKAVDSFYLYYGTSTYYIASGKDSKGVKRILWIPEKGKRVVEQKDSAGVSKESIISKVNKELHPDDILSVKLGMENNVPLWEVVYKSGSSRLNYEYFDFNTGDWLKYYRSI